MLLASTVQKLVRHLVSTNIHLGHKRSQQHPKMSPYIYKVKNNFQIIDLRKTYWFLKKNVSFLYTSTKDKKSILFVGTKKHLAPHIEKTAIECKSFYVTKRWLGGLLTNWKTIKENTFLLRRDNSFLSKKQINQKNRRKKRILNYLGGVLMMSKLPDVVIIFGQRKELNAVKECLKLKIPILTILDTDCNPNLTTYFIPANDDSLKSTLFILEKFSKAIQKGQKYLEEQKYLEKQKYLEEQKYLKKLKYLEEQRYLKEQKYFEKQKYLQKQKHTIKLENIQIDKLEIFNNNHRNPNDKEPPDGYYNVNGYSH